MLLVTYSNLKYTTYVCGIEEVKIYIDSILVLVKGSLSQCIDMLIIIFDRQSTAGIKFDYPK